MGNVGQNLFAEFCRCVLPILLRGLPFCNKSLTVFCFSQAVAAPGHAIGAIEAIGVIKAI
jgi:hypothetical protein